MTGKATHTGLGEHFPPLSSHEASVEANRCLYCYDAPCTHACPTHIDIPKFIRKISTGNLTGSARTIFESNLLGSTCARVCPVQELCEGACVLGAEHKPVMIGRLQRFAMDHAFSRGVRPATSASPSPHRIAVIGSGPAGLSCAGELALRGHSVTVFEKRELPGGLSTYGIISLREPVTAALAEVEMIRSLGVQLETGKELGANLSLQDLQSRFDAVFLGLGLGATNDIGMEDSEHTVDGLWYIEQSKLNPAMKVGSRVAVIGAGNTAIDCATVAKRLGADQVTIIYRRSEAEMTAYPHEYEFIKKEGVHMRFLTQPIGLQVEAGAVTALRCRAMALGPPDTSGRRSPLPLEDSDFFIPADQVVMATGQQKPPLAAVLGLETERGFVRINSDFETSLPGVFAGGDCIRVTQAASTVMAVQDGKLAAAAIHMRLTANEAHHG